MDFAFTKNGYRYHTKFDGFSNILSGSLQHIGDNALFLIKSLASAPELQKLPQPKGNVIFYDFVGLFMVSYSQTIGVVINVITILISISVAAKGFYDLPSLEYAHVKIHLAKTLIVVLLGWILSVLFILILAIGIDSLNFTMSWYANPWLILGLYATPVFIFCCLPLAILNRRYKRKYNNKVEVQIQAHFVRLIWTFLLLLSTCLGFRFGYVIMMPVLFHSLAFGVIQIFKIHSGKIWVTIYVIGTLIPGIFLMVQALNIATVLIPICGRIGPDKNPELIVGFLVCLLTLLITSCYVPLITLVAHQLLILAALAALFLTSFIIVFTPLGFAYSGNAESPAPQRFWIYHTSRKIRNDSNHIIQDNAGFFLLNMDRNSPKSVKAYLAEYEKLQNVKEDCNSIIMCGFPITTFRVIPILNKGSWIQAESPVFTEPVELILHSRDNIMNHTTRFSLLASGPDHFAVYISPKVDVKLVNISLVPIMPAPTLHWNKRPVYIILHTWGKEHASLRFTVDFQIPMKWNKAKMFDIAIAGSYLHNNMNTTHHYERFLKQFPNWADVQGFVGIYESWVF